MIAFVISWNTLLYMLFHSGLIQNEIKNRDSMEFYQYHETLLQLRILFVSIATICLIPMYLKKTLYSLERMVKYFLVLIFILYLFILISLIIERSDLEKNHKISIFWMQNKEYGLWNISIIFPVFSSFYTQPYLFTFKRSLLSNYKYIRSFSAKIE